MSEPKRADLIDTIRTLEQQLHRSNAARTAAERSVEISAENHVKILREVEMLRSDRRAAANSLRELQDQLKGGRSDARDLFAIAGRLFSVGGSNHG